MTGSTALNRVTKGDCLDLLTELPNHCVDLIYLDPPFGTQKKQTQTNRAGDKTIAYEDRWDSTEHYMQWLADRLVQCKRVLKESGAMMVHCDWRMSHRIRVLLDDVMGEENFRNEIIWSYRRWTNIQNSLQRLHQTIFYYARSSQHDMNVIQVDYSPTTNIDQIWQARSRDDRGKSIYAKDENGREVPYGKSKDGVPLGDVWEIPFLNPKAKERTGYPTQKPVELLLRILEVASSPGNLVLDPFCGSGTTLVAAKLSGRSFIGFDVSEEAIALAGERLQTPVVSDSVVTREGREYFLEKSSNEEIRKVLKALNARTVERNKNLDGVLAQVPAGVQIGVRVILDAATSDNDSEQDKLFADTLSKKQFSAGLLIKHGVVVDEPQLKLCSGNPPIVVASYADALQSPEDVRSSVMALLSKD